MEELKLEFAEAKEEENTSSLKFAEDKEQASTEEAKADFEFLEFSFQDPELWKILKDDYFACRTEHSHIIIAKNGDTYDGTLLASDYSLVKAVQIGAQDMTMDEVVRRMLEEAGELMEEEESFSAATKAFTERNAPDGLPVMPGDMSLIEEMQPDRPKMQEESGLPKLRTAPRDLKAVGPKFRAVEKEE